MAYTEKKGLQLLKQPLKDGKTEVSPGNKTGLTGDQKFSLLMAVSAGVAVACLLAMIALLANWWQFANNSFNEYTKVIHDYNGKRYTDLENRILKLENTKDATQAAKPKLFQTP